MMTESRFLQLLVVLLLLVIATAEVKILVNQKQIIKNQSIYSLAIMEKNK